MRQHLSPVVGTSRGQRLDPASHGHMLRGARGARNLPVGDLAHDRMQERVLGLARQRGATLAANELFTLERVQQALHVGMLPRLDGRHGARPEHLPDHRGVVKKRLLFAGQSVDARGHEPVDGVR